VHLFFLLVFRPGRERREGGREGGRGRRREERMNGRVNFFSLQSWE
jgi:hypothetical protein